MTTPGIHGASAPSEPLPFGASSPAHVEWIIETHRDDGDSYPGIQFAYLRLSRNFLTHLVQQAGYLEKFFQENAERDTGTTPLSVELAIAANEKMCFWNCDDKETGAFWAIHYREEGAIVICEYDSGDCATTGIPLDHLVEVSKGLPHGQFGAFTREQYEGSLVDDLAFTMEQKDISPVRQGLLDRAYASARALDLEAARDDGDRDVS